MPCDRWHWPLYHLGEEKWSRVKITYHADKQKNEQSEETGLRSQPEHLLKKKYIRPPTHPPSSKQPNSETEGVQLEISVVGASRQERSRVSLMTLHGMCSHSPVYAFQKESRHFTCHQKLEMQKKIHHASLMS